MAECGIGKKFLAELIGTFFLVFFGTGSAVVTLLIADGVGDAGIGLLGGLGDWIAIGFNCNDLYLLVWKNFRCSLQPCSNNRFACN